MSEWNRVSKASPCPVCGKPDWCLTAGRPDSPDAAICARTESPKRCGAAGWLHVLRDSGPTWTGWRRTLPQAVNLAASQPAAAGIAGEAAAGVAWLEKHPDHLERFAAGLWVSAESLRRLGVGYSPDRRAWLFPMTDVAGEICGARLRLLSGRKLSIKGGREGLFLPSGIGPNVLLLPEGPTDTAALLGLGFSAVGRPSCRGGAGPIVELCRRLRPARAVVVSDADAPGRDGAAALAQRLRVHVPSVCIIEPAPEHKDMRAWARAGAIRADVQAAIDAAPALQLAITTTTRTRKGRTRWATTRKQS